MKTSEEGKRFITRWEGVALEPYLCPAGKWTIGVGHRIPDRLIPFRAIGIHEAMEFLEHDLRLFEYAVNRGRKDVPVEQHQFDALVSLAFNIGVTAFSRSTLLRVLVRGDDPAPHFVDWCKANGEVVRGLRQRRLSEAVLYKEGRYDG